MRILHVLDHSIPLHSGYTFRTAALLREQCALGWETYHVTSPKQGPSPCEHEVVDGLKFFRTPVPQVWGHQLPVLGELMLMSSLTGRLRQLAREIRPDVIHAHSPVLNALPALKVGAELGIPVAYEIRAFWEDAAVDHGTTKEGSLRYRSTRALETHVIRNAAHVFTICEGLRADISARGISADKVTVIPNAVDVQNFHAAQAPDPALMAQWKLEGRTVLGFLGSFYAYEGLDLLIAALPQIRATRPDVCLLLVGGGPQESELKNQVATLGLTDHVRFTGRVPHSEVARYYDLVNLLVYPRHAIRLTELVTPLKPLEAMAQGHLVVASDVGGHRELIEHGRTGWLFKADDRQALAQTVLRVLAASADWPGVRLQGRAFVEHVRNWRNSVANYVEPYQRMVRASSGIN